VYPAAELVFEDAVAAYEDLIDSTCAERRPRRVALLAPRLDCIAGAERQVILIAKELHARGWQVSVIALSGHGRNAAAELAAAGVEFRSVGIRPGIAALRGWLRFILWLRRARPDVVHAHLPRATWLARWSRLFARIPVVIDTLHNPSTGTIWSRLGYRLTRGLSDRVTAVSETVAGPHLAAKLVNEKNLVVLPNGVNLDHWHPDEETRAAVRREMGLENQFLWIAAGRLDTVKDYPTLLKAMASLPKSARLVVAGSGPLLNDLSQLASRLNLGGRVRFLGFDPNVKRWFQAADGFVLVSHWEGLPVALLEASACALPSVATDVPGVHELLDDGETGVLVPAMDVAALAWAMDAIMQAPPEERRAIGMRARHSVAAQFSLASAIDRWEELYGELLAGKSALHARNRSASSETRCATAAGQTHSS